jgi:hypothetical protein
MPQYLEIYIKKKKNFFNFNSYHNKLELIDQIHQLNYYFLLKYLQSKPENLQKYSNNLLKTITNENHKFFHKILTFFYYSKQILMLPMIDYNHLKMVCLLVETHR